MGLLNWLTSPAIGAVDGLVKTVFGSQADREQNAARENTAANDQYAAEFQYRGDRTKFDSLIDGLNRLPRPLITLWISWLVLVLPISDRVLFTEIMLAYSSVPEMFWYIFASILAFYFGGRMVMNKMEITDKELKRIQAVSEQIRSLRSTEEEIEPLPWLENKSVAEWKAKKGK